MEKDIKKQLLDSVTTGNMWELKDEIYKKLKDDDLYYGEYGKQFLSNSDINNIINLSYGTPTIQTKEMLLGSYFHTAILEPNKINNFEVIDVASRNTKLYKEACDKSNMKLLMNEKIKADTWVDKMKNNEIMKKYLYDLDNIYEKPEYGIIMDNLWKGKADIITKDYVIDLKTTTQIESFKYKAEKFCYHSQAYIYQRLFNKQMIFLVICKDTLKLKECHCSPEFIQKGRFKVEEATEKYNKFYSKNKTENPENYVEKEIL